MTEDEYKTLAAKATEALDLFRSIQAIHRVKDELGTILNIPASGFTRLSFEMEHVEKNGMINRRYFSTTSGDFFFNRTVREFRSIILRVEAESSDKFGKL